MSEMKNIIVPNIWTLKWAAVETARNQRGL